MSGPVAGPSGQAPERRGTLATLFVAGVAVLVVFGAVVGFGPHGTTAPTATPGASATPAPGDQAWASLGVLPPLQPLATLTPVTGDAAGVAADTGFTLASLTTTTAQTLALGLATEPALALRIAPGKDATSALIRPATPLEAGRRYRFRLTTPDGALAGQWSFQVKAPLHVVTALPGDRSTEVPVNTGIELTFDQDGVIDAASHFAIDPAVTGRFETHGRTLVFVPSKLEPATLYTITLSSGIGMTGSDERLEQDVRIRFETAFGTPTAAAPFVTLGRAMTEAAPDERAVISLFVEQFEDETGQLVPLPASLPVEVYRLADTAAAIKAARVVLDAPDWARTSAGLVSTAGLTRVMAFDGKLEVAAEGAEFIRLPDRLPAGPYLVVLPRAGRDLQGLLQVTRVASYTQTSSTRSLVWTNAIAGGPLAGVKVDVIDGPTLGTTDARGLLVIDTPTTPLSSAGPTILRLTSPSDGQVLVPLGLTPRIDAYLDGVCCAGGDALAQRWWTALSTDRALYRQTDTVNLWGYLRDRDTNAVPAKADVRLILTGSDGSAGDGPPIAVVSVAPRASGAFVAALDLADVPLANYEVQVMVDGRAVASNWITVGLIRKPAYQISLALDRHVFIAGDSLQATATARFFEGTVAPAVPISFGAPGIEDPGPVVNADAAGVAGTPLGVGTYGYTEGLQWEQVTAGVAAGEEGFISAEAPVLVFPSQFWLEASPKLVGSRLTVSGTINKVDVQRLEREFANRTVFGQVNPKGAAVAGSTVTATITEHVPVRRLVGQRYDFVTKRTINDYRYDITDVSLGTRTLSSGAAGTFNLSVSVPDASHDYSIELSVTDAAGRAMNLNLFASGGATAEPQTGVLRPYLGSSPSECGSVPAATYDVGQAIHLTMRDGYGSYPTGQGNAYLFTTAQQGIRDIRLQASPTLDRPFGDADVPNLEISAVRFNGRTYLDGANLNAAFKTRDRQLTVTLTADAANYRPGGVATVTARTLDQAGHAVAATVTLRAVDEKIYALGGAQEEDPLGQLYAWVGSGLEANYASHAILWPPSGDGCGGVGGGGDGGGGRQDFRDTLFYRQLDTGPDGIGTVTFQLSDDLTSWHLSAAAVTGNRYAGVGSLLIPVGLPFFVEPTLAPEYLLGDRPSVRLRAFGSDLHAGDAVTFTVASDSLGMAPTTVSGRAFESVDVPLPALRLGDQALVISGATAVGALTDRLTRRFSVVDSRLMQTKTSYETLTAATTPQGGPGLTTYLFSDNGRGRYLPVLQELAWGGGPRLDQAVAASEARRLLVAAFGVDAGTLPDATFDPTRYQHAEQGIALLPYGSPSLELTIRAVLAAPGVFDVAALRSEIGNTIDVEGGPTREQRIQVLLLEAALGDDVLSDVRAASTATDLSERERLYLALAASALGDGLLATDLERAVLADYGERLGPWVRLGSGVKPAAAPSGTPKLPDGLPVATPRPSAASTPAVATAPTDAMIEATALWAIVAVEVGDPLAGQAEAYVEANPAQDDLTSLQRLAFAARAIERTPAATASFAYTVDGARTVVALDAGATRSLTLTAAQRATLHLEPLGGEVGMATTWRAALDPGSVSADPTLTLTRKITPAGPVASGQLVTVDLTLTFGKGALKECADVVDLTPSGLAPLAAPPPWLGTQETPPSYLSPYDIAGQRVAFCASLDPGRISATMRYFARVVTPGTYAWEPASAQSGVITGRVTLTGATTIELR